MNPLHRTVTVGLLAIVSIASSPKCDAQSVVATSLVQLGTLGGGDSAAEAINNFGQATGQSFTSGGALHAYLYSGGTMTDLGTIGGTQSSGYAMNNSGQVTGVSNNAGETEYHAFLSSGGTMTDLGTLGGTQSYGYGINNVGHVVGDSSLAGNATSHGFLYAGGGMADLGTLGGTQSYGYGINDSGQVVGGSTLAGDSIWRAFVYSGGTMSDLGTLGGTWSHAYDINNSGQIVGESSMAGDTTSHAYLHSGGTMTDLGVVDGDQASWAYRVNNLGQVVGGSWGPDSGAKPFLYAAGRMRDLNAVFASQLSDGTTVGFTKLTYVSDINDLGQISGSGDYFDGVAFSHRAFIASFAIITTPPTSLASLGVVHNFQHAFEGTNAAAAMIVGAGGRLYGTTRLGGAYGEGTAFSMLQDGTSFTVLRHFNATTDGSYPAGALTMGADGRLYGMTSWGGQYAFGTVFAMQQNGSQFTVLHHFGAPNEGQNPRAGLVFGTDGRLYGATAGGGTNGLGTIFSMASDGTGFVTLRSFSGSSDGRGPYGGVIQGVDGRLYGTTTLGGTYDLGTLFALNANGSGFVILRHFSFADGGVPGVASVIQGADGRLYGVLVSSGNVYAISTDGSGFTILQNLGNEGRASVIQGSDGRLYGMARQAGNADDYVYALQPDGSGFTVLYQLVASTEGRTSAASLVQGLDGRLYGSTQQGGAHNDAGTLFALRTSGFDFTVLRQLSEANGGKWTNAGVIQASDGKLYGTMPVGGNGGNGGTVYRVNPNGSGFSVLWSFNFNDVNNGASPQASLVEGSDGRLYGTTYFGGLHGYDSTGVYGNGTVFAIARDGSGFTILRNLVSASDGRWPGSTLVRGSDARLYGQTTQGGAFGKGTLFAVEPASGNFTVLRHINSATDGAGGYTDLIAGSDGRLYGTMPEAGPYGDGVGSPGTELEFAL